MMQSLVSGAGGRGKMPRWTSGYGTGAQAFITQQLCQGELNFVRVTTLY